MNTYRFKKETKGYSITIDDTKISFSDGILFRGYALKTTAILKFYPYFDDKMSNKIEPNVESDTIYVGDSEEAFDGTALELIDELRDTIFY